MVHIKAASRQLSKVQKAIHAAQRADPSSSTVELDPDFGSGYYNLGADGNNQ